MKQELQVISKTKNISVKIMQIMLSHIGEENGIGKKNLYTLVYDSIYNPKRPEDWMKMDHMAKVIRNIRRKTTCFIVINEGIYFVMSNKEEMKGYHKQLDSVKIRLEEMRERSTLATKENWHNKKWGLYIGSRE